MCKNYSPNPKKCKKSTIGVKRLQLGKKLGCRGGDTEAHAIRRLRASRKPLRYHGHQAGLRSIVQSKALHHWRGREESPLARELQRIGFAGLLHHGSTHQRVSVTQVQLHVPGPGIACLAVYSRKIVFSALLKRPLVSRPGVHSRHPGGDMRPVLADDTPCY